jgi:hypothetical protein
MEFVIYDSCILIQRSSTYSLFMNILAHFLRIADSTLRYVSPTHTHPQLSPVILCDNILLLIIASS